MNILALDTTSAFSSIAVLRDGDIVLEYNFTSEDNLSAMLIPSMEFILKSVSLKLEEIDLFGIGIGPGLFTGIRVGLATLKGILFPKPKPLVPVITLKALACKFSASPRTIVPLIDARRDEVYLAGYRFDNGQCVELLEPSLIKVSQLAEKLANLKQLLFVGSGAENHRDVLKKNFPEAPLYYRSFFLASEIGKIAFASFQSGQYIIDLQQLLPLYIRRPDAEAGRKKTSDEPD